MKYIAAISLMLFAIHYSAGQDTGKNHYANCINEYTEGHGNPADFRDCMIGVQVPPFHVVSTDGQTFTSEALRGKIVLLNFWFTSCAPCIKEIPLLNALYENMKTEQLEIISFAPDKAEAVALFARKYPMAYPVVADAEQVIENTFRINSIGYPINILVDQNGKIIEFRWTVQSKDELELLIRKSLTY